MHDPMITRTRLSFASGRFTRWASVIVGLTISGFGSSAFHRSAHAQDPAAPTEPAADPPANDPLDVGAAENNAENNVADADANSSGQEDLDKATLVKLSAKSMGDLENVISLCESALKKGLDDDNQKYARDLMTATLYDQASRLSRLIFDQQPVDSRWPRIRQLSLERLYKAAEIRPEMGNVHLLIARLQILPNGDREKAQAAVEKAITLLADDASQLSVAYQTRSTLAGDPEAMLKDLAKAIEVDSRNLDAWRMRGVYYLTRGELDKALADFQELLAKDPDDLAAHQAIAQTFRALKQYDKALEHIGKALETDPQSSLAFNLRAQIFEEQGNIDGAVENLNEAIKAQPQDLGALLMRARLRTIQEQFDLARSDLERVLQIRPGLPQAILLRSLISASQDRLSEAIGDIQQLLRQAPENEDLKLQLATYYEADRRPRRAIELYTEVIQQNEENWSAYRRRGDAYLSVGKHAEAIADYNRALEHLPEESGLLNNLAWVLATSPEDGLRNGQRALELAKKACELTEYKAPHIISTLAACHAELGQFDEAIRLSEKAAESDPEEEQLSKEVQAYKESKPWREKQLVEENAEELKIPEAPTADPNATSTEEADELRALEEAAKLNETPAQPPAKTPAPPAEGKSSSTQDPKN